MNIVQVYFNHLLREPRVEVTFSDTRSRIDLANDLAVNLTGVVQQLVDGSFRAHSSTAPHTDDGTVKGSYILGYAQSRVARIDVIPRENRADVVMLSGFAGDKRAYLERFAGYLRETYIKPNE